MRSEFWSEFLILHHGADSSLELGLLTTGSQPKHRAITRSSRGHARSILGFDVQSEGVVFGVQSGTDRGWGYGLLPSRPTAPQWASFILIF